MLPIAMLAGCATLPPLPTPTVFATPIATPTPTPSATPASPSPTQQATPDPASVPAFTAGEVVRTAFAGMRVRRLPGTDRQVVAGLLGGSAALVVIMGPIQADGFGWYLVRDADPAEPEFGEAWIAAGYEPEPFLVTTAEVEPNTSLIASFANAADAEYGPIEIPNGDVAIRWLALDPEAVRCTFAVSLATGGRDPVPAIRATLGASPVPGTLQPSSFDALGVRGQAFLSVDSDCAWTLVVARVVPQATPSP